jgi:hypothetical protein
MHCDNGLAARACQHYAGSSRSSRRVGFFDPAFRLHDMRSKLARPLIAVTVRVNVSAAMVTDRPFSKSVRRRLSSSGVQSFRCSRFIVFSLNILGFGEFNSSFESGLSFSTHSFKSSNPQLQSKFQPTCTAPQKHRAMPQQACCRAAIRPMLRAKRKTYDRIEVLRL